MANPPESGETGKQRAGMSRALRFASRGFVVLASIVTLILTAAGWVAFDRSTNTSKVLTDQPSAEGPREDAALDILLVGSDSRTDALGNPLPADVLKTLRTESTSGLNTDTLILMRIPHDGSAPTAVSIPRDLTVTGPGHSGRKINGVYGLTKAAAEDRLEADGVTDPAQLHHDSSLAGQRALIRSVQQLTGVRIDHYAEVNLLGFYEITEALGGVEVCLNQATSDKDSGAEFAAGHQTISGGDALSFVRQRHGLPRGDLDRIVRQQAFMAGLVDKVLATDTLTNPARMSHLVEAARRSVLLDEDWNMGAFIQRMRQLAADEVRFETLPIETVGQHNASGQSVVTVDREAVRRFIRDSAGSPPRMAPQAPLRLDGTARKAPISSDSIPCVN